MISRASILSTAETALEAESTFSAASIIAIVDDGTKLDDIEDQLNTTGCVLVITPVVKYTPRDQAGGSLIGDATFIVRLMLNPTINAKKTVPLVFETLRAAVSDALIGIAADDHGERYRMISDELTEFDAGLLAADIVFERSCQVNAAT